MTLASSISRRWWSLTTPALWPPPAGPLQDRPAPRRSAGHQAQAVGLPADAEYSLPGTRPGRRTRLLLGSLLRTLDRRQGPRTARRPEPPRHSPPRIPGISSRTPGPVGNHGRYPPRRLRSRLIMRAGWVCSGQWQTATPSSHHRSAGDPGLGDDESIDDETHVSHLSKQIASDPVTTPHVSLSTAKTFR